MFRPANKSTLHDNILLQLINVIKLGAWRPGEKLPGEQELAKRFEVSRNCIREVLKALGLIGVIEAHPGQGTFLTRDAVAKLEGGGLTASVLGDASLWELIEMRLLLEGQVAYLAAQRASAEEVELLRQALQDRTPEETYKESDFRFHKALATIAGNTLLKHFLDVVQGRIDEVRKRYKKMPGTIVRVFDREHKDIFESIRDRRPEDARQAIIQHIEGGWIDALYAELKDTPLRKKPFASPKTKEPLEG